jgi:peptidoglycan/xylan/chitin deacetylase (PgdA/CDA1 family)
MVLLKWLRKYGKEELLMYERLRQITVFLVTICLMTLNLTSCSAANVNAHKVKSVLANLDRYRFSSTVLSRFDSKDEWTLTAGGPVEANSDGLRLTSRDGYPTRVEKAVNVDLSNSHFAVSLFIDNIDQLGSLSFYVKSESGWSRGYTPHDLQGATWWNFSFGRSNFLEPAEPDWAHITGLAIQVTSQKGSLVDVSFRQWEAVLSAPDGLVTLTFDDGHKSAYAMAKLEMDKYGFSGVAFVVIDRIGEDNYHMTWADLEDLQKDGWDVSSHTLTHADLTTLSAENLAAEMQGSQQALVDRGFKKGSRFLAVPMAEYNGAVLREAAQIYTATRTGSGESETLPLVNPNLLRARAVAHGTSMVTVASWITSAKKYHEWLILIFHDITASAPSSPNDCTLEDFQSVLHSINESGLATVTFSDLADHGWFGEKAGYYGGSR